MWNIDQSVFGWMDVFYPIVIILFIIVKAWDSLLMMKENVIAWIAILRIGSILVIFRVYLGTI